MEPNQSNSIVFREVWQEKRERRGSAKNLYPRRSQSIDPTFIVASLRRFDSAYPASTVYSSFFCFHSASIGSALALRRLLGPILSAIHTQAIAEKAETGKIRLWNAMSWFRFSADGSHLHDDACKLLSFSLTSLIALLRRLRTGIQSAKSFQSPRLYNRHRFHSFTGCDSVDALRPFTLTFSILTRDQCSAVEAVKRSISLTTNHLKRPKIFYLPDRSADRRDNLTRNSSILLLPVHFANDSWSTSPSR